MALTVANLQTNLAYRLGETSAASDANTKAQRLEWLNMAYMNIARRRNWWWQETGHSANVNTGSTTGYPEPTDCKALIELKISSVFYDEIPYRHNRVYENTLGVVSLPTLRRHWKFYRFGGKYYLIPTDGNDAAVHYIKFYQRVTKRTLDADTFLIPDEYLEGLCAYAEARYWQSITQQGKSVAPFQEFEEVVAEMTKEQNRRQPISIMEPEDANVFNPE